MTPLLDVSDVTLRYKTSSAVITATERVSFSVDRSDRFVLLGPSGCGKSTLLKAVGGYMTPSEGKMRISGREISEHGADRIDLPGSGVGEVGDELDAGQDDHDDEGLEEEGDAPREECRDESADERSHGCCDRSRCADSGVDPRLRRTLAERFRIAANGA